MLPLAVFIGRRRISMRACSQDDRMKRTNSSMQLTRAADYAVRVMIHLAAESAAQRVSLPDLAAATDAPESFLSKVLQSLSRAGLISSRRGQAGGFQISPSGREASMRTVIEAIDGTICLNVCLVSGRSCHRKAHCPAHPVWAQAQRAMLDVLSAATIAELALQAPAPKTVHSANNAQCICLPAKLARR
jgi:Rrf2 family protein